MQNDRISKQNRNHLDELEKTKNYTFISQEMFYIHESTKVYAVINLQYPIHFEAKILNTCLTICQLNNCRLS